MPAGTDLQKTLSLLPWPIAVIGSDGRIESLNAACAQWLDAPDSRGVDIATALRAHPELVDATAAALAGEPPPPLLTPSRNGHPEYRVFLRPIDAAVGGRGAVLYAEPTGEYIDTNRGRRRRTLDSAIDKMSHFAFVSSDPKEILDRMVATIVEMGIGDSAAVYVLHDGKWIIRHASGLPEDLLGREVTEDQVRPSLIAARENRIVIVNALSDTDPATREWLERFQINALIDGKIDLPWGDVANVAIHYHAPSNKKFSSDDEIFLQRILVGAALALRSAALIEALSGELIDRTRTEEELRRSEDQLSGILSNLPVAVFVVDTELRLLRANGQFERMFEVRLEHVQGRTVTQFMPRALGRQIKSHCHQALESAASLDYEEVLPAQDGRHRMFTFIASALRDEAGQAYAIVTVAMDITERKRMEEQIRHTAQHDSLTGLPNRLLLSELLTLELAQARRNRKHVALLYLDLDRFKQINDELGHETGDKLLEQVAVRLTKRVRRSDVVARIGGDEFNVILTDLPSPERITGIIHQLLESFAEPFVIANNTLHVSPSVGISVYPGDGDTPDMLRRHADIAMYEAKRRGRNQYVFYNSDVNSRFTHRLQVEHDLHGAIERKEFRILLQPMVEARTLRVFSAEALVRWAHPQRGLLAPAHFLPLAEEMGVITEIEEWVLCRACEEVRRWNEAGAGSSMSVTVNLSSRQFMRPDLADVILKQTDAAGIDPDQLQLEITEERAMDDIATAIPQMQRLRETGVSLALDDFGTGYSSLNYLKRMPVSLLKIDQGFVRDIAVDPNDRAVVEAVSALGHSMHISVLAEGIENEQQLSLVTAAGCDSVQGFLIGAPLAPASMLAALSSGRWPMT